MKDWVIIIGTLLILLVLADGIRRKRNERMGKIKVSRSLKKSLKQPAEDDDEPLAEAPSYTSELPNGGARVVGKRDSAAPIPSIEKKAQAQSFTEKQRRSEYDDAPASRHVREPQQASFNLGQSVPILMESVEDKNRALAVDERIEPSFSAIDDNQADLDDYQDGERDEEYEGDDYEDDDRPYAREPVEDEDYEDEDEFDSERETDELNEEYADEDDYDERDEDYDELDENEEPQTGTATKNNVSAQPAPEPEEVLIINVMAHKGEMFNGGELLDIILKCGMRYGSMDIFHRYSDAKGEGVLLFSMANMVKPGTFDLDAMDDFETPGVSLFMTLPINADSMQSFDLMADTARAIAETLGGELKDEQRSVMTRQTLEHCRQRIRDFERMRLFRRPPR